MREWCAGQWKTPVGATEYPVELMWKPAGPPRFEHWQRRTAHGAHPFVVIWGDQPFQPVSRGGSVVVEKSEHLPSGDLGRSIASCPKAAVVFICQNNEWHRPGRVPFLEIFPAPSQQLLIMIDAHDYLDRW